MFRSWGRRPSRVPTGNRRLMLRPPGRTGCSGQSTPPAFDEYPLVDVARAESIEVTLARPGSPISAAWLARRLWRLASSLSARLPILYHRASCAPLRSPLLQSCCSRSLAAPTPITSSAGRRPRVVTPGLDSAPRRVLPRPAMETERMSSRTIAPSSSVRASSSTAEAFVTTPT